MTPVRTTSSAGRPPRGTGPVARGSRLMAGLVLFAVSMAMLVHAGLGAMPWDVLTLGIQVRTGASFGLITGLTSLAVLACWWPLRQRPGLGTVANVIVIGALVNPALSVLDLLPPLAVGWRVLMLVGGVVTNAVATGLYIGARLGPGPRDGLMTGLVARTGWSVRVVKTAIEVAVVAVGWLLGGTVGVGTLVYAVGVGPLIHLLLPRLTVPAVAARPSPEPEPEPEPEPVRVEPV